MLDSVIESVKTFVSEALIAFAVAAFIGDILIQLGEGSGLAVDINRVAQITITAVVVGIFVSIVIGALKNATK